MAKTNVLLGYKSGTGEAVYIPIGHMVVTGQTQAAGKTTTLEALVKRSGLTAIAFITKRGEGAFAVSNQIPPFFRERADWQFVASLIDATLSEKNKILRAWLMKVCRGTKTLAEVQRNVKAAQKNARGFSESIYTEIDGYLDMVVPELKRLPPAHEVALHRGLNVMDLSGYSSALQALVIRSVVEHIYEHEQDVVTVIPEAWEFLPELRGSPCKQAVETLIRKGGGLHNFLWVDSQDLAGVWKLAVRAAKVYLIGVQREANEIKRTLSNIPDNVAKPKAKDVATLGLGEFYACWGKNVERVYVQPNWMDAETAIRVAQGEDDLIKYTAQAVIPDPESRPVGRGPVLTYDEDTEKFEDKNDMDDKLLREVIERQTDILDRLTDQVLVIAKNQVGVVPQPTDGMPVYRQGEDGWPKLNLEGGNGRYSAELNIDEIYDEIKKKILKDPAVLMKLSRISPEIEIDIERPVINLTGNDLRSWLAVLLSEGFFDNGATGSAAFTELKRRGKKVANSSTYAMLDRFADEGFVTKEGRKGSYRYTRNPELKINRRDR